MSTKNDLDRHDDDYETCPSCKQAWHVGTNQGFILKYACRVCRSCHKREQEAADERKGPIVIDDNGKIAGIRVDSVYWQQQHVKGIEKPAFKFYTDSNQSHVRSDIADLLKDSPKPTVEEVKPTSEMTFAELDSLIAKQNTTILNLNGKLYATEKLLESERFKVERATQMIDRMRNLVIVSWGKQ